MTNNTATQSGADIYGGLLDRCTINQNAEYEISSNGSILDYINNTIKSSTELSISSGPVQVMFVIIHKMIMFLQKRDTHLKSVLWLLTKLEIQRMPQFTVLLSLIVDLIVSKKDRQNKQLVINAQN